MWVELLLMILCLYPVDAISKHKKLQYSKHDYPEKMTKNKEHEYVLIIRLHHLNMLIFKDVILKVRLAEKLQNKYKGTLAYDLGILTSEILDNFRHMLNIYAKHTEHHSWKRKTYSLDNLYDAYHAIHGRYMQILKEKDLYYEVLERYKRQQQIIREQRIKLAKKKYKYQEMERRKRIQESQSRTFPGTGNTLAAGQTFPPGEQTPSGFTLPQGVPKPTHPPNLRRLNQNFKSDKEYKMYLRMRKWGAKWDNFDPKREGIDIDGVNVDFDKVRKAMQRQDDV